MEPGDKPERVKVRPGPPRRMPTAQDACIAIGNQKVLGKKRSGYIAVCPSELLCAGCNGSGAPGRGQIFEFPQYRPEYGRKFREVRFTAP